jgi:hypothetical protein
LKLPPKQEPPSIVEESLEATLDVDVRPGETVIVDSLIGQVNGRPIFADEILAPVMDQLNADFDRMPWQQFRAYLIQVVSHRLSEVIHNELFLSEARSELNEQQQTGFLAWMNQMRGDLVGERGGITAEAEQQILAEEGKTIDEYLRLQEEQQLIGVLMQKHVRPNALVAWRDVERAWEARQKEFNESPSVTLGRIRILTEGNEEQAKLIQDELDAGEPFDVVADAAGMGDGGVWDSFKMGPGGIASIEIAEFYKPHLEGLGPGETSKGFVHGTRTIWVSVIEVTNPKQHSLYDPMIQRALYRDIYARRIGDAQQAYIKGILDKGIYDDLKDMESKVVSIALSRFQARR